MPPHSSSCKWYIFHFDPIRILRTGVAQNLTMATLPIQEPNTADYCEEPSKITAHWFSLLQYLLANKFLLSLHQVYSDIRMSPTGDKGWLPGHMTSPAFIYSMHCSGRCHPNTHQNLHIITAFYHWKAFTFWPHFTQSTCSNYILSYGYVCNIVYTTLRSRSENYYLRSWSW